MRAQSAIARPALPFSKMHGAGNDFVVLDLRDGRVAPDAALCRRLADRHGGVGCDQILTIEPPRSRDAVAAYGIWNADGSSSRQCGNGARCVADWLVRRGAVDAGTFFLDSPAGHHAVEALGDGHYRIAMGVPDFAPATIPLAGFERAQDEYAVAVDSVPGARPASDGSTLRFGAVSMGNPHAVIVVDDIDGAPVAEVGAALQQSPWFTQSVNVGFAQVVSRDRIRLRVFERGVGETLACGSGACAAAAVLMRRGAVDREISVSLPGGDLRIAWPHAAAPVAMAGPTAFVFEGEWTA